MMWNKIVRRTFTVDEFRAYVMGEVKMTDWRPSFVVVHNTSEPTMALFMDDWMNRKGWNPLQWADNLAAFYSGKGWRAGPHFFVMPNGLILAFTPMTMPGVHTPSWNNRSLGVETVGEFSSEPFDGIIRDTLISMLATLHEKLGLDPVDYRLGVHGLHFHKEDMASTHRDCPGRHVVKPDLVAAVAAAIHASNPGTHEAVPVAVQVATEPDKPLEDESNTSVEWVQEALNRWLKTQPPGIAQLNVDGSMGPATKAAVRAFQREHGMKLIDGIAGPLTRAALRSFT